MNKTLPLIWLAVALPIVVCFGPALLSDRSFAFRDAGHFYYPLFEWCCGEWAAGRVPLWNPYENCGVPSLAETTSSVFYPGKLLFLLPLQFAVRFKLYIVAHVMLAALGSYWLARVWKASRSAAALAAIAYSCGGSVVFQYSNVVFLVGAAWLPLAALAADRMLRNRSWISAVFLAVVLALMILGGDPQMAYHALLIAALYALVLAIFPQAASAGASQTSRQLSTHLSRWALIPFAAASAYLLAAVQILPSAEALEASDRVVFNHPRNVYEAAAVAFHASEQQALGETKRQLIVRGLFGEPEEGFHHELAYDFSVGPWRLIEYFWPNIGGRMFPTHRRWLSLLPAEGRIWTPTLYMGLLPIVLALFVFRLRAGSPREVWLSLIVLVFTLGAFGAYGAGWLLREIWPALAHRNPDQFTIGSPVGGVYWLMLTLLPKYVYFRYPAKLLPLVALAISQLAARGFDEIAVRPTPRLRKMLFTLGCGSGVLAAGLASVGSRCSNDIAQRLFAWCVGPVRFANIDWNDHLFGPFDAAGAYHDVLLALTQTAIVAIAGWWLMGGLAKDGATQERWKLCLALLTAADVAFANGWLIATAPVDAWRGEPEIVALARSNSTSHASAVELPPRVFRANLATWRPASFSATKSHTRPAEIVRWERDTLFPKHHLANGLTLVESYSSIKWADYDSLLSVAKQHGPQQPDKSLLPQPTALRLLGTEFLVLPDTHRPNFADRVVSRGTPEGAALWRMSRTLPRAWIVHDVEVASELPPRRRRASIDQRTFDVLFPEGRPRDFLKSAVIETNRPPLALNTAAMRRPTSGSAAAAERCEITHYSPQRVVLQVDLHQAGLVVLSDAWDPGWRAFVTSGNSINDARIYRTNRVLRGVWIPAGKHTIEYRFRSQSFLCGALISCLSWLLLTIALIVGLRLNKRSWRAS